MWKWEFSMAVLTLGMGFATGSAVSARQASAPPLVVSSAVPDSDGQTLIITGEHFIRRPLVTLDLVPVTVQSSTDSQIVAAVPVNMMPPGSYLLTVSRGPADADNGSLEVTLGGGRPKVDEAARIDSEPATLGPSGTEPAARVGDRVITVADVDQEWRRTVPGGYVGLSREIYQTRRRVLDQMVADELIAREAKARGLTPQALVEAEIPKRIVPAPESAVLALYQSLGDRTRGAALEQMRPALRAWLTRHTEPELAKMNYVEELMKVATRAEVLLAPPRVRVPRTAGEAVLGPDAAPVELVAFGDFQSLDYARFARAFGKMRETFGDKVRLVFKHLPLSGPESAAAAEAGACANAQGKFWALHDAIIVQPGRLDADRLKQIAGDVRLDRRAFDGCLDGGTFKSTIRQALDEAERYAVTSSPRFLVNGALAPPPPPFLPPFEFLKRIIEEELLRVSAASRR